MFIELSTVAKGIIEEILGDIFKSSSTPAGLAEEMWHVYQKDNEGIETGNGSIKNVKAGFAKDGNLKTFEPSRYTYHRGNMGQSLLIRNTIVHVQRQLRQSKERDKNSSSDNSSSSEEK